MLILDRLKLGHYGRAILTTCLKREVTFLVKMNRAYAIGLMLWLAAGIIGYFAAILASLLFKVSNPHFIALSVVSIFAFLSALLKIIAWKKRNIVLQKKYNTISLMVYFYSIAVELLISLVIVLLITSN